LPIPSNLSLSFDMQFQSCWFSTCPRYATDLQLQHKPQLVPTWYIHHKRFYPSGPYMYHDTKLLFFHKGQQFPYWVAIRIITKNNGTKSVQISEHHLFLGKLASWKL
jgi:hypothetical protein